MLKSTIACKVTATGSVADVAYSSATLGGCKQRANIKYLGGEEGMTQETMKARLSVPYG